MNKQKLLNDVLAKHGGKCVREEGRNYWVKGEEKALLTGGFLMHKMREEVVKEEVVKKVVITKTVTPNSILRTSVSSVTETPKPVIIEQPVKRKVVVVKPQTPDVKP